MQPWQCMPQLRMAQQPVARQHEKGSLTYGLLVFVLTMASRPRKEFMEK